ncbi:hypothetical protein GCM10008967_31050 [Bacillus carboniphilus]|uniref:DNase/tRNase domain of colicin-like bacteriocin n=1 Tax=Bacillus carboniphilus TaxID=86663 RepID=A0ABN0WI59_9BACI
MGVFRGIGKVVNTVGGGIATGGVKMLSKVVSKKNEQWGQYIGEVGTGIVEGSKAAIDSVGQFADGTVQGTYGLLRKDEHHKQRGWTDMKDSTGRTLKGFGQGIKYTVKSAGITLDGIRRSDQEQILEGVKNLGKVAAVTTFAVGVIDIIDGPNTTLADTRNGHLNGLEHPETGIPFMERTIELQNGETVTGTFPVFDSHFSAVLAEEMYLKNDATHFAIANDALFQSIHENPSLARELELSSIDLHNLESGRTPEGYVWHHHEQPGVLQLVNEDTHLNTGHTGGREIWGGGNNFR